MGSAGNQVMDLIERRRYLLACAEAGQNRGPELNAVEQELESLRGLDEAAYWEEGYRGMLDGRMDAGSVRETGYMLRKIRQSGKNPCQVADEGLVDRTMPRIQEVYPDAIVVRHGENQWVAVGREQVLRLRDLLRQKMEENINRGISLKRALEETERAAFPQRNRIVVERDRNA